MVNIKISKAKMAPCSICKKYEELRPYGKDGAWVCFDCGKKDEKTMHEQFQKQYGDADLLILGEEPETEN